MTNIRTPHTWVKTAVPFGELYIDYIYDFRITIDLIESYKHGYLCCFRVYFPDKITSLDCCLTLSSADMGFSYDFQKINNPHFKYYRLQGPESLTKLLITKLDYWIEVIVAELQKKGKACRHILTTDMSFGGKLLINYDIDYYQHPVTEDVSLKWKEGYNLVFQIYLHFTEGIGSRTETTIGTRIKLKPNGSFYSYSPVPHKPYTPAQLSFARKIITKNKNIILPEITEYEKQNRRT